MRVEAAGLAGIADRHVVGRGDQRPTASALQDALAAEQPSGPELDAALAELREQSTNPGAYIQAAAPYTDVREPTDELVLRLLELAGADIEAARQHRAENPPRGFSPPQATPEQHRRGGQ